MAKSRHKRTRSVSGKVEDSSTKDSAKEAVKVFTNTFYDKVGYTRKDTQGKLQFSYCVQKYIF